jgi:hypothetical protein
LSETVAIGLRIVDLITHTKAIHIALPSSPNPFSQWEKGNQILAPFSHWERGWGRGPEVQVIKFTILNLKA